MNPVPWALDAAGKVTALVGLSRDTDISIRMIVLTRMTTRNHGDATSERTRVLAVSFGMISLLFLFCSPLPAVRT